MAVSHDPMHHARASHLGPSGGRPSCRTLASHSTSIREKLHAPRARKARVPILARIHIVLAVTALLAGLVVTVAAKGTASHRTIGWVYVTSLAGVNASALFLYRLTGHFGPFHVAAFLSLVTLVVGVRAGRRRQPAGRWVRNHAYWMSGSYVGLLAAAAAEVMTRIPRTPFWWMAAGTSLVVIAVGARVIALMVPLAARQWDHLPGHSERSDT